MIPDKYTLGEHMLSVGDGHKLYIYDWGKKDAKTPILFLHGGPGNGVNDRYRQRFEPTKQRVIFFDQRGCGKSTPSGSLKNNTTDDLVEDIEKIAKQLKLDEFVITGGSWGSCLALAYALKYPKRIKAMVLSGIYAGSKAETDYLLGGEWRTFFPDVWEQFLERTPRNKHDNPIAYHYKKASGENKSAAKKSIYAVSELESSILSLDDRHIPANFEEFEPDGEKIEMHYLKNDCFMPDRYIMKNAHRLKMPIWLVQGRYDFVCPPITAYELNKRLPNSQLIWTVAGHGNDRANYDVVRTILLSAVE